MEAIIAINRLGYIGLNGGLPWPKCSADLAHFRQITDGKTMVAGRVTAESLAGLNLGNRKLITLSRSKPMPVIPDDAIIIGGALIYYHFASKIKTWHVSLIADETKGDVYFSLHELLAVARIADATVIIKQFQI